MGADAPPPGEEAAAQAVEVLNTAKLATDAASKARRRPRRQPMAAPARPPAQPLAQR